MARVKGWNKFGAKKTTVDGITFDSKREAARYQELKLLLRAGEISHLKLQPRYPLYYGDQQIRIRSERFNKTGFPLTYVADFEYTDKDGQLVVEDVKGHATQVAKIKLALFQLHYGLEVRIVR